MMLVPRWPTKARNCRTCGDVMDWNKISKRQRKKIRADPSYRPECSGCAVWGGVPPAGARIPDTTAVEVWVDSEEAVGP